MGHRRRRKTYRDAVLRRDDSYVSRFIGILTQHGAKSRARRILDSTLSILEHSLGTMDPERFLRTAVTGRRPRMNVKTLRVHGEGCRVPVMIPEAASTARAIREIVGTARQSKGGTLAQRLANELLAAYEGSLPPPRPPARKVARLSAKAAYQRRA